MENLEEAFRLELKTDPDIIRKQALWCGLKPGLRVLDVGCGPGKITSILHEMVRPDGSVLGIDYSEERINYSKQHYGEKGGIDFQVHDPRKPLKNIGLFDLIWVRFFLEYNRIESPAIAGNLTACLKPGGYLCLMDLDHNCLNHYELPPRMEKILIELMGRLEERHNFDPFAGRKLYSYLYDLGYKEIQVELLAHHLFYAKMREEDIYNWIKKVEVTSEKAKDIFEKYPGGKAEFFEDFKKFFLDPRRFTYTPLILCKGMKPK